MLVLEELSFALRRGARIYAEMVGYGTSANATRITDSPLDGFTPGLAMKRAIDDAGVSINDIQYVNAHGTSTQQNDKSETAAIKGLFGEYAYQIPISSTKSMLGHWPVQLTLVPPTAPFLQGADLVLAADCVPFAYAGFHQDFLRNHSLLVACPKLDDFQAHLEKLTDILSHSKVKSLTVVHMEVPCCSGLVHMAKQAIQLSGKDIPFKEVTVSIKGDLILTF